MDSLPGWTINIDEVSNGVFKITLKNVFGNKAEVIDSDFEKFVELAKCYAFDIEKQISKRWNWFLFEFAAQLLQSFKTTDRKYQEEAFGSWYIECDDNRVVYDGRDSWLYFQERKDGNWKDMTYIKEGELNYWNFLELVKRADKTI